MNTLPFPAFRRLAALAALVFLLTAAAPRGLAQVTIYAKFLDGLGNWAGESTDPGRTGWAKLDSIALSFTNPTVIGGAPGPVVFNPGALTKAVDRLTPQIFANLASGSFLRNATLPADLTIEFVKQGVAGPVVYFRVELKLVLFSSQKTDAATGDESVRENVEIQFGATKVTTWPILGNGTLGPPKIQSWSRVFNNSTFEVD